MSEDAPELTAELAVDGVVPSKPVISPDGCWVAYVVETSRSSSDRRQTSGEPREARRAPPPPGKPAASPLTGAVSSKKTGQGPSHARLPLPRDGMSMR